MKIALLGAGKTGGEILKLHKDVMVFNKSNPPSVSKLVESDIVISFLAGEVFLQYIPMLIESELPVVTGSTGFSWPKNIDHDLKIKKLCWIRSHNFSLGMNIVKAMIETLSNIDKLYDPEEINFKIHDIHHAQKLDAPSGTALSWEKWLDHKAQITSERTGDVIGYHHLEMDTSSELITLTHEAKDRAIFAKGALWAAKRLFNDKEYTDIGLINFTELVQKKLKI